MITSYNTLKAPKSSGLDALINAALLTGWTCFGDPYMSDGNHCQAMVQGTVTGGNSWAGTAAGTSTYTTTIAGATPLLQGSLLAIKFTNAPTGPSTLAINGTTPIPIKDFVGAPISLNSWGAGQLILLSFDGVNLSTFFVS